MDAKWDVIAVNCSCGEHLLLEIKPIQVRIIKAGNFSTFLAIHTCVDSRADLLPLPHMFCIVSRPCPPSSPPSPFSGVPPKILLFALFDVVKYFCNQCCREILLAWIISGGGVPLLVG